MTRKGIKMMKTPKPYEIYFTFALAFAIFSGIQFARGNHTWATFDLILCIGLCLISVVRYE